MGWAASPRYSKSRKRWYVRLGGRQYILGYDQAEAYRRFAELLIERPAATRRTAPRTIATLCEAWLTENPGRWYHYIVGKFAAFAGVYPLNEIPRAVLGEFAASISSMSPKSRSHCLQYAWRVLQWGKERGHIDALPAPPVYPKIVRNPRDIAPTKLLAALRAMRENRRLRAIVSFMLATGCRPGEARMATWDEFDIDAGVWNLPGKRTKTRRSRTIYLNRLARAALRVARKFSLNSQHVFLSRRWKPWHIAGLHVSLQKYGIRPHSLRHSYAQAALEQGVGIATIAKLLGHSDLKTVEVYAQVRDATLRRVAESLVAPQRRAPRHAMPAVKQSDASSQAKRQSTRPSPRTARR